MALPLKYPRYSPSILMVLLLHALSLTGQEYQVGVSHFDQNEHVEYIHGNMPLILSAPHGGEKRPEDIEDRSCSACVTVNDAFTQELLREVSESITSYTGCTPYSIINRLHRSKLDANRSILEGADEDPMAEDAWEFYHEKIAHSREEVSRDFGGGLFIDLHGHAHTIQRLELGYLLSRSQLSEEDEILDQLAEGSSVAHLAVTSPASSSLSDLIRGSLSLGTVVAERGYDCVPSSADPYPMDGEAYFTGGYNTQQYGSRQGGVIDAIQIECNQDVRFDSETRRQFADSLAVALLDFLGTHYSELETYDCAMVSVVTPEAMTLTISPNPTEGVLSIKSDQPDFHLRLYDSTGEKVLEERCKGHDLGLDLSSYPSGIYRVMVTSRHRSSSASLIKIW